MTTLSCSIADTLSRIGQRYRARLKSGPRKLLVPGDTARRSAASVVAGGDDDRKKHRHAAQCAQCGAESPKGERTNYTHTYTFGYGFSDRGQGSCEIAEALHRVEMRHRRMIHHPVDDEARQTIHGMIAVEVQRERFIHAGRCVPCLAAERKVADQELAR